MRLAGAGARGGVRTLTRQTDKYSSLSRWSYAESVLNHKDFLACPRWSSLNCTAPTYYERRERLFIT